MAAIGEISARSGVPVETIRYYERIKLVAKPPRLPNGRRSYDDRAAQRLAFIRRARELGFRIDDVRALLVLADERGPCRETLALTQRHREAVRAKIKELERLDQQLSRTAAGCDGAPIGDCPIISALAGAV